MMAVTTKQSRDIPGHSNYPPDIIVCLKYLFESKDMQRYPTDRDIPTYPKGENVYME